MTSIDSEKIAVAIRAPVKRTFVSLCTGIALVIITCSLHANPVEEVKSPLPVYDSFSKTMELYDLGKWAATFEQLAFLADEGKPEAARVALMMHRFRASLYGDIPYATKERVARWTQVVSKKWAADLLVVEASNEYPR